MSANQLPEQHAVCTTFLTALRCTIDRSEPAAKFAADTATLDTNRATDITAVCTAVVSAIHYSDHESVRFINFTTHDRTILPAHSNTIHATECATFDSAFCAALCGSINAAVEHPDITDVTALRSTFRCAFRTSNDTTIVSAEFAARIETNLRTVTTTISPAFHATLNSTVIEPHRAACSPTYGPPVLPASGESEFATISFSVSMPVDATEQRAIYSTIGCAFHFALHAAICATYQPAYRGTVGTTKRTTKYPSISMSQQQALCAAKHSAFRYTK